MENLQNSLNEDSGPGIGLINGLLSLNPFGKTAKIVKLMKEANSLKLQSIQEKGAFYKKVQQAMEKYFVAQKISEIEQKKIKEEYQEVLKKNLSSYAQDLDLPEKDVADLVDEIFKKDDKVKGLLLGSTLEKVPDVKRYEEALSEKIVALEKKSNALVAQARDLATDGKDTVRSRKLYSILYNWLDLNAANEAIKMADAKQKSAIQANINRIKSNQNTILTDYKKTDLKSDNDKKDLNKDNNSVNKKEIDKDSKSKNIDFDYKKYESNIGLSESQISTIKKNTEIANKTADKDLADATDLRDRYERLVDNVINGSAKGLLVYGEGGLGKSFTVEKALKDGNLEQDKDYYTIKAAASPIQVFKKMQQYKDKLIVFDDCDSLWNTEEGRNLLKGALDSREVRRLTWAKTLPKEFRDENLSDKFDFTGKIIFLSNKTQKFFESSSDTSAILTRIPVLDFTFNPNQTRVMVLKLLNGNKINWKDYGVNNESVTEEDRKYIEDIINQVYGLYGDKITKGVSVRPIGVAIQTLKDSQRAINSGKQISPESLRKEVFNVITKNMTIED